MRNHVLQDVQEYLKEKTGELYDIYFYGNEKSLHFLRLSKGILKKNAWIVWTINGNGQISDMKVYERDLQDPIRSNKIFEIVEYKMKGLQYRDVGCIDADWDEVTLQDLLFKFGFQYGFADKDSKINCLDQLSFIEEFRDEIYQYITEL